MFFFPGHCIPISSASFCIPCQWCAQPCSLSLPHPLPSLRLRQYFIRCLLNTWRQSQWGNDWGPCHVCTLLSLTDHTSIKAEEMPCCCKGRWRERSVDWWSAPNMSNMIQQMSLTLELIKSGICCCFFIWNQTWSCAQAEHEGGLSPTLNHKDAGIHEMGTHTHTQPAMTCLLHQTLKTDFEETSLQKS